MTGSTPAFPGNERPRPFRLVGVVPRLLTLHKSYAPTPPMPKYPLPPGHYNNGDDFEILMQGSAGHLMGSIESVEDRTNLRSIDDMIHCVDYDGEMKYDPYNGPEE